MFSDNRIYGIHAMGCLFGHKLSVCRFVTLREQPSVCRHSQSAHRNQRTVQPGQTSRCRSHPAVLGAGRSEGGGQGWVIVPFQQDQCVCVCVQIFTAQRLRNAIYTLLLPDYSVGVLITVMNVSWRHIKISFCVLGARLVWLRKAAHITATRRHRAQLPLYTTVHFYLQRGAERELIFTRKFVPF